MEDEDFLEAIEADNANVEEPKAETPPVPDAPKEPEAEAPKEPEVLELTDPVTPEAPKQPEPGFVPIAAMLDARDKAKAAEAELQRLKAQQPQQQFQMPDPFEDPEGFAAVQEERVRQSLYQTNLRWSERIASMQHGPEVTKAATEWGYAKCDNDPYFNAKVASSPDPIGFVVSEYKREEIASKVTPDEFAQFQAWKAAQGQLQQQAPPGAPPNATSAIPPKSLASAPSAGNILTEPVQSDDEIFNEVIGKR